MVAGGRRPRNLWYGFFCDHVMTNNMFIEAVALRWSVKKVFPCEFCEIFKNTFFTEHLRATAPGFLFMFCRMS